MKGPMHAPWRPATGAFPGLMSWHVTSASTQVRSPSSVASACGTSAAATTWQHTSALTPERSHSPVRSAGASLPAATRGKGTQRSTYGRRTRRQKKQQPWLWQQRQHQLPHLPPATPRQSPLIHPRCLPIHLQSPPATPPLFTLPTHLLPLLPPTLQHPCQTPISRKSALPFLPRLHPPSTAHRSQPHFQTCRPPFPRGQSRSAK